ncbi:hypothetical protein VP01_1412g3 [Puccinia sorghi]|uniref:PSP1 C-terminal domain-containing protein n=1 Tax=Puccinia sorghi TaxID=27349 RepID=A0A0L6VKS8_9BASI|nr:hypothetical protein VP01_1412g3 [Puccinia sorghi]
MLNRRFSHLSSTQQTPNSPLRSPASVTDPIGPISLTTDRYRGSLTPTSPLSTSFGPNSLPSNFYQPWYDSNLASDGLLGHDERIGRSKARDILGTRQPGSYRDPSVGSIGSPCSSSARSGIGLSNMSPFTGTSLLPPGGPISFGGSLTARNLDIGYRSSNRARDSSLGAIGSGRMTSRSSIPSDTVPISSGLGLASSGSRMLNKGSEYGLVGSVGTDSWLTGGRSLSNDLNEDDEFAPPTKSGATSRRHSVSAFTGGRSLIQGFESVSSRPSHLHTSSSSLLNDKRNHRTDSLHSTSSALPLTTTYTDNPVQNDQHYGLLPPNSSTLTDEDLCFTADFNSLNLDLDTQQPTSQREPASDHRLGFQFSNHYQTNSSPFHQPKPNHLSDNNKKSLPPFNNMSWSSSPSGSQAPPPPSSIIDPLSGPGHFARKSSFSAGDPFSASAQASRYLASQAGNPINPLPDTQPPVGSRFPFSHSGSALQPLCSLSSPSVTTFSASGLLSAPSPHSRHAIINGGDANNSKQQTGMMRYSFDPSSGPPQYYSASASSHPHLSTSPLSPMFQIPPGISAVPPPPAPLQQTMGPSQLNNQIMPAARSTTTPGPGPHELSELGKGVPLHQMPVDCRLYIVEFKGGRTDLFYVSLNPSEAALESIQVGDLVIVEADRGKDLGKVVHNHISIEEVKKFQNQQVELILNQVNNTNPAASSPLAIHSALASNGVGPPPNGDSQPNPANMSRLTKEIHPKKIFGKASTMEVESLQTKMEEERKALSLCRSKALQRGLKMEITAAEWQWDRRKLTFFFIADKRVDFRDLVKDLFRTWKTRIWMCSVNP